MAMIDLARASSGERVRYDLIGAFQAGWRAFLEHRRKRRVLVAISRLPPHIIRDFGLDPERVYEALDGSWDEVDPATLRRHLPRRERI